MKITILEENSFLGVRLIALLKKHKLEDVELLKITRLDPSNSFYLLRETSLLIVDLDHQESDPLQLIKRIKENSDYKKIEIITISTSSDVTLLKKLITAGCSDFIIKPFNEQIFIERIFKALGKTTLGNDDYVNELFVQEPYENYDSHDHHLKWHKGYEIGIFEIDKEHQDIINQFETLYQLMIEGKGHAYYANLLSYLGNYVNTHFAHEEAFHQKVKYPYSKEHKAMHEGFKRKVLNAINQNETRDNREIGVSNTDLIRLNLFIKEWLMHHILIEDRKLGEFIGTKQ